ncbi:ATP-dependent DNA ligase [[Kitasatospora] papulosa]
MRGRPSRPCGLRYEVRPGELALSAPCPAPAPPWAPYYLARHCYPPSGSVIAGGATPCVATGTRLEKSQISAFAVGFLLVRLQESTNPCASVFDVLQRDGQELVDEPFARRREVLEALFASCQLEPPWTLCPSTTDPRGGGGVVV